MKGTIAVATVLIHNGKFVAWHLFHTMTVIKIYEHLNIIGLHHTHLSFLMHIKTSNQTIYILKSNNCTDKQYCVECFSEKGKVKCYP